MRITTASLVLGVIVAGLGLLGLVAGEGRVAEEMNVNLFLDIARLSLGAFLIYGGVTREDTARSALSIFGIAYIGMFILGILDSRLFGLTPDGLGMIDHLLHIGGGIAGLFLAKAGERNRIAY